MIDQYGVLAWKPDESGGKLILLVTSRDTRRWVVPRGNAMWGKTGREAAEIEAWEEAGIRGAVGESAIGLYRYDKRTKAGLVRPAEVMLFPLRVELESADWPERHERDRRWFAPAEAARAVDEPSLADIITRFAAGVPPPSPPPRRAAKAPALRRLFERLAGRRN